MVVSAFRSCSRSPRTMMPEEPDFEEIITCPSTTARTDLTPAQFLQPSGRLGIIGKDLASGLTITWPFSPRILSNSSLRNPFMTESTMMSVATPSAMPITAKTAITDTDPLLRRARR